MLNLLAVDGAWLLRARGNLTSDEGWRGCGCRTGILKRKIVKDINLWSYKDLQVLKYEENVFFKEKLTNRCSYTTTIINVKQHFKFMFNKNTFVGMLESDNIDI